jgi:hypothetical protein
MSIRRPRTTVFGRCKWADRPFKGGTRTGYARLLVTSLLRSRLVVPLLGLAALLFAGVSEGAPTQDAASSTPVPLAGVNLPKTYARSLGLSLAIPGDYQESGYRQWSGPSWHDPKKPSVNGIAGIQWFVKLDTEHTSAAAAATDILSSTAKYSRYVSRGPVGVPHVAQDGGSLGSIGGFSVIVQSSDPKANAQYQGAVAFQLARPTPLKPSARKKAPYVVVRFKLELPSSDRYVVGPGLVPSSWNLERTRAALAGVRLVGSMPPGRMTVTTRSRRVSGAVVDMLGHSVGGAFVTVYRVVPPVRKSAKPTFSTIRRVRTNALGRYTLDVPATLRPGSFRIVARLGESAVSRPLRLRVGG